jgi:hypothetical protein
MTEDMVEDATEASFGHSGYYSRIGLGLGLEYYGGTYYSLCLSACRGYPYL